jgi:hypothetical protein
MAKSVIYAKADSYKLTALTKKDEWTSNLL